jgi:methionyl aminopeptidase
LAKKFLNYAGSLVKPGVTTDEIDRKVHEAIVAEGAHPTPIGYPGDVKPFPKSICTSVNEVLGHGIPDSRPLEAGDVISIDVSLYYNGFHGDTCGTFYVGTPEELEADPVTKRLIEVGRKATAVGVKTCKPGAPISSIGQAIQSYVEVEASSTPAAPGSPQIQYLVSPYLTGHGIGRELHLPPSIIHVKNDIHDPMVPGLTFTIEPIIIEHSTAPPVMDTKRLAGNMIRWRDGWTIVSADGKSRASQFEDTVLITEDGYEILTYDPESEGPRQVVFSTKS